MAECKESICRNCFHSYVCEQFNENKDDNNEKCHFFNDHYVPTADVVPKSEYDAVVSAVDNSTKEFLKLHDDYQEAKSEVDEWKERCIGWYEVSYLKSQRILELEAELSKAKGEVEQIFEEIEKILESSQTELVGVKFYYRVIVDKRIAELKKKYAEGKT